MKEAGFSKDLYLSKSRYCSGVQCPKMLWMKKYREDDFDKSVVNTAIVEAGSQIGDLAMGYFGPFTEIPFGKLSEMMKATYAEIKKGTHVICEASFEYNGLFCSVDILINHGNNEIDFYEVKSSKEHDDIKEVYYNDIAYQYNILKHLGFKIRTANLMRISSTYVRHGDIDIRQLFVCDDVTETVVEMQDVIQDNIVFLGDYLHEHGGDNEPDTPLSNGCFKPYPCGFFKYCSRNLPQPNVFNLAGVFGKGFNKTQQVEAYTHGLVSFEDIKDNRQLTAKQRLQVQHELNKDDRPYINEKNIRKFLDTLTYPLYFLDFETVMDGVPRFDNSAPYSQIPFQYSLHYINKPGGTIYHKQYLAWPGYDPRRELAEQLCNDIPLNVCTTAYHMQFEKGRISELAELFPDLRDHLMNIHKNIKDLEDPFRKGDYYKREFVGRSSIKVVLPGLFPDDPEMDYKNLEGVHNGGDAIAAYRAMSEMTDKNEIIKTRNQLLKYCYKDTYAMVGLLYKLYEAVGINDYLNLDPNQIIEEGV